MRWMIWEALGPSQLLVLAVLLGALLLALGRDRPGRWLCVSGAVALLLFGVLPLAHYLVAPLEQRFPPPRLPAQVAGILLLAGAERPEATAVHGEPQLNSHGSRFTTTLRLAQRYPGARIVFSGGPSRDPATRRLEQTGVARMLLPSLGLDPARLTFEERSRDTCESAVNASALLNPRPDEAWVVVSSALHLPRVMACFRAVGWEVIPQPADYQVVVGRGWGPGSFQVADNLALLDLALHEWLGLAYYRLAGRTRTLFPAP